MDRQRNTQAFRAGIFSSTAMLLAQGFEKIMRQVQAPPVREKNPHRRIRTGFVSMARAMPTEEFKALVRRTHGMTNWQNVRWMRNGYNPGRIEYYKQLVRPNRKAAAHV